MFIIIQTYSKIILTLYVINPQQTPIIYHQPVQNDFGIGFHRMLDGLTNRVNTLQEENQHLRNNCLIEIGRAHV